MEHCEEEINEIRQLYMALPREVQKLFFRDYKRLKERYEQHAKSDYKKETVKPFLKVIDINKATCSKCKGIIEPIKLHGGVLIHHCCDQKSIDEKQVEAYERAISAREGDQKEEKEGNRNGNGNAPKAESSSR